YWSSRWSPSTAGGSGSASRWPAARLTWAPLPAPGPSPTPSPRWRWPPDSSYARSVPRPAARTAPRDRERPDIAEWVPGYGFGKTASGKKTRHWISGGSVEDASPERGHEVKPGRKGRLDARLRGWSGPPGP